MDKLMAAVDGIERQGRNSCGQMLVSLGDVRRAILDQLRELIWDGKADRTTSASGDCYKART